MDNKMITSSFGTFIRDARLRKPYTQAVVAARLNISQVYYSQIELGKRNIDLALALEICKVLELDINDFVKTVME
jgi:transcriptional regulator with XRE-family HTH domain